MSRSDDAEVGQHLVESAGTTGRHDLLEQRQHALVHIVGCREGLPRDGIPTRPTSTRQLCDSDPIPPSRRLPA
ncbi:hypothetical protein R3Q06_23855 [Rhodococcus erythropolis]|uniref:hypothetical protein n=1 Tax=Rhodococcus erythropolis TaxID=1833 RepID=UPI002948C79A|nr:hypothetical protein [Rhodococcus erythropolis]MDV6276539.1 hypothetical protein [Rhodococcus erythropolis]